MRYRKSMRLFKYRNSSIKEIILTMGDKPRYRPAVAAAKYLVLVVSMVVNHSLQDPDLC